MKFFTALLPFVAAVLAAPAKRQQCTNPAVRVEWRSLTQEQRNSFHQAIKCMQTKPSDRPGQSLYDRYSSLHEEIFGDIHYVAAFLPWHRYFSWARDISMRECGYNGPITYWDWTRDVSNMPRSEMFDPVKGFGGDGQRTRSGGRTYNCVQNGPYGVRSGFSVYYHDKHCLERRFNMGGSSRWWNPSPSGPSTRHSAAIVAEISQNDRFDDFRQELETRPHDAIHNELMGDMAAAFSPNDPLFFQHHNQVDRIWAQWQGRNQTRLQDYVGNTVQNRDIDDATLDNKLTLGGLQGMPDITVRDVMDTQGGVLCYKYDK